MAASEAGVMIWSPVLMSAQDGIVRRAAAFERVPKAAGEAARWAANSASARASGGSAAKCRTKLSRVR
jgi:hypothetical protein